MAEIIPNLPQLSDLPASVQALRKDRERAFVWFYMMNGADGAKAARLAGFSDVKGGARVRAFELLHRSDIQDALKDLCQKYLFSLAPRAMVKLSSLLDSENERVALKATDMVLARTGFAERTALDVNVGGSVTVNHKDAAVEDLRRLKALGVPRAELERTFGFSGLTRYEKMLEIEDKRAAEPIDAEFTEIKNGS